MSDQPVKQPSRELQEEYEMSLPPDLLNQNPLTTTRPGAIFWQKMNSFWYSQVEADIVFTTLEARCAEQDRVVRGLTEQIAIADNILRTYCESDAPLLHDRVYLAILKIERTLTPETVAEALAQVEIGAADATEQRILAALCRKLDDALMSLYDEQHSRTLFKWEPAGKEAMAECEAAHALMPKGENG